MNSNESYTDFDIELAKALEASGESPIKVGEAVVEEGSEEARRLNKNGNRMGAHLIGVGGPGSFTHDARIYDGDTSKCFDDAHLPHAFQARYKREKVEHRIVAYLKAQGLSNRDIAIQTGYSYGSVCHILQLPWTRQVILEEIAAVGRDAVKQVLEASTLDSVYFLLETRDDDNVQRRDRITAAKELLDRTLGKANQPITYSESKDPTKLSDKELAQIVNSAPRSN